MTHEKNEGGKKTNKLNSILSQETLISQDNNTLADDLVRGKEKEDIAATVPQRKPEHWREQGISCGPSTAMQVCAGKPLDAILTAANSEEGRAQTRRLHFKTCTQPAVSPREVRSIRVALHKRSVCHLRACARERKLVHEACNLYKCGRCSYQRLHRAKRMTTCRSCHVRVVKPISKCSTSSGSAGESNGPSKRVAIKQNVRRPQRRKERRGKKEMKGTGSKTAVYENERGYAPPQWTFKKL